MFLHCRIDGNWIASLLRISDYAYNHFIRKKFVCIKRESNFDFLFLINFAVRSFSRPIIFLFALQENLKKLKAIRMNRESIFQQIRDDVRAHTQHMYTHMLISMRMGAGTGDRSAKSSRPESVGVDVSLLCRRPSSPSPPPRVSSYRTRYIRISASVRSSRRPPPGGNHPRKVLV